MSLHRQQIIESAIRLYSTRSLLRLFINLSFDHVHCQIALRIARDDPQDSLKQERSEQSFEPFTSSPVATVGVHHSSATQILKESNEQK